MVRVYVCVHGQAEPTMAPLPSSLEPNKANPEFVARVSVCEPHARASSTYVCADTQTFLPA